MVEGKKSYRNSRLEFERHINLLIESILSKKRIVPKGYAKPDNGISKMRYSPNKRMNLSTIDERTRTMAMTPAMGKYIKSLINNKKGK